MIINHNLNAMNAHRNMGSVTGLQGKAMEKLSSGQRINRAGDDAAGLAISEKMRSQIRGLNQASRNAQDGVSMIQTSEGALSETHAIGQRMRELAVQSANGTYTDEDRKLIDQEFGQLKNEIDRIANETEFNGSKVLNGEKSGKEITTEKSKNSVDNIVGGTSKQNFGNMFKNIDNKDQFQQLGEGNFKIKFSRDKGDVVKVELSDHSKFNENKEYVMDTATIDAADKEVKLGGITIKLDNLNNNLQSNQSATLNITNDSKKIDNGVKLQVGANEEQNIGFDVDFMRSRELGLGGVKIDNVENAQNAIKRVDEAVSRISSQRSDLGAIQNRLEHTIASTDNTAENLQAAESRIRDVDMAKEMMNLTKLNVLQQASQAMLSQANQAPQQVLSILR